VPHVEEAEHDPSDTPALVELDAHAHAPHESNGLLLGPLWVLSFFAVFAGFLNFPHWSRFATWVDPRYPTQFQEIIGEVAFNPILATISVVVALAGGAIAWAYYAGRLEALHDLSLRNGAARVGKRLLVNKYYLDHLYEDVIVDGIRGPVAAAVYWVNQHIIDNVLNYTGRGVLALGRWTYDYVDQKGVDGLVNGLGAATGETGGVVRRIQTGRLQFYALMLVGAVGVFALALWIFT
jgi:NADH-quinone oxidoreductase subunit L